MMTRMPRRVGYRSPTPTRAADRAIRSLGKSGLPSTTSAVTRLRAQQGQRIAQPASARSAVLEQAQPPARTARVASGQLGVASFYWQPQRVASGGWFNPNAMTAAHRSLPFGTRVKVTPGAMAAQSRS
jgi:rare lipoprotein A